MSNKIKVGVLALIFLMAACNDGGVPIDALTIETMTAPIQTQIQSNCGDDADCIEAAVANEIEKAKNFGLTTIDAYNSFVDDLYGG